MASTSGELVTWMTWITLSELPVWPIIFSVIIAVKEIMRAFSSLNADIYVTAQDYPMQ